VKFVIFDYNKLLEIAMTLVALFAISSFMAYALFQPRVALRRNRSAGAAGCSETTCLLSYTRPRLERGPDARLTISLVKRNLMLAGYGWAEPAE
jgi:hypothetical protein